MATHPLDPDLDAERLPVDPRRLGLGLLRRWRQILGLGVGAGTLLALGAWSAGADRWEARLGLVKRQAHNEILLDRDVVIQREDFSMSTVAGSVKTLQVLQQVHADTDYPGSLSQLSRSITVENPRQTELLVLRVTDEDPRQAAAIARSLMVRFQEDHAVRALANAREAVRVLTARREVVSRRLVALDEARMGLLAENGFSDVDGERTALLEQRSFAEQALVQGREELRGAEQAQEEFGRRQGEEPAMITFSATEDLPLQRDLARVEVQLAGLLQRYTLEHPQVLELQEQAAELRRRIAAGADQQLKEVTQQANPLRGQLALESARARVSSATARTRVAALEDMSQRVNGRLELLRSVERRLFQLDRELQEARELLLAYRNGIESAEILLAGDASAFEVVEEPQVPTAPLPTRRGAWAGLAFLGALAAAVGLALVLELLDTRVRSAAELQELGLTRVHVLPPPRAGERSCSYALAAQVLFGQAETSRLPVLAGLTEDALPEELARALQAAGAPAPEPARAMAETVLPGEWRERSLFLVVPADRIPRATVERWLRRARQLGAPPVAAIFVAAGPDQPFDTLEARRLPA